MADPAAAPLNDTKSWYASKTVWGGLIATAAPIVAILLHRSAPDAATLDNIASLLAAIGGAVGGLYAIYGRLKAASTITR